MFPQSGQGFIWDKPNESGDRVEAFIFVPDSKKIFNVSISSKDIKKDDMPCIQWIEWKGVGERDACKPIPLIDASLIKQGDSTIFPEYTNQATFKSVLLFPDRQDLVEFVGEHNAWSPYVGIVSCDETEVQRGVYAVAYIERNYAKTESAFVVNKSTLKFPQGYHSDRHQTVFEGLAREIELAKEEADLWASKGKNPAVDTQVIPTKQKPQHDDIGGFEAYGENPNVIKTTDVNRPGWSKYKSADEIAHIERIAEFIKNRRVHDVIVYKHNEGARGFVGFAPVIGSIPIYADSHKITGEQVKLGMNLHTRVEFNKRKKEFAVESVADIKPIPFVDFKIRSNDNKKRKELVIKCLKLDLSDFKVMDEKWKGKRVGVIEHPILEKVLAFECDVMKEEWKGQKVTARLLHYEGLEKHTPLKIRLLLEKIEGIFEDGSLQPLTVSLVNGRPDSVDSDDDDDEEEGDEGCPAYSNEDSESEMRQMKMKREREKPTSAFASADNFGGGFTGGFNTTAPSNQRGNQRDGNGGGYGRSDRGGGNGGRGGRGGGGVWNNQGSSSYNSAPDPYLQEGHGFGAGPVIQNTPVYVLGMLVCYSRNSSIFYTEHNKLVKFSGDVKVVERKIRLGDSAEFEMEPAAKQLIPFRVVQGSLRGVKDMFGDRVKISAPNDEELYVRDSAYLIPTRLAFNSDHFKTIKLGENQIDLKLYSGQFIEKTRVKIGNPYSIYLKFNTDDMEWRFDCIDNRDKSFELEEEDEIDRYKKQSMNERSQSRNSSSRSGDEEWERVSKSDKLSKFSIPSRQPSTVPSTAPSIASASSQMTTSTIGSDNSKEMRALRKENEALKRMLCHVWEYKPVQVAVKQGNYFLFESVDDWYRNETEEASEKVK